MLIGSGVASVDSATVRVGSKPGNAKVATQVGPLAYNVLDLLRQALSLPCSGSRCSLDFAGTPETPWTLSTTVVAFSCDTDIVYNNVVSMNLAEDFVLSG